MNFGQNLMSLLIILFAKMVFIKAWEIPQNNMFELLNKPKLHPTHVIPLIDGVMAKDFNEQIVKTASVTLVQADGITLIVDSPAATDFTNSDHLFKNLAMLNISHVDIRFFVTTHGHPDHFGQSNFFQNADHFYGAFQNRANRYKQTALRKTSEMRLTESISLWSTPGHTTDDISVIVTNVEALGVVGITGDLIYSEEDILANGTEWMQDALNPYLGQLNRLKMICAVNYIVPGHSHMFKVTDEMKYRANCHSLTETTSTDQARPPIWPMYRKRISANTGNAIPIFNDREINQQQFQYSPSAGESELWKANNSKSFTGKFFNYPRNYNVMATPVQKTFSLENSNTGEFVDYLHAAQPGSPILMPNINMARVVTKLNE